MDGLELADKIREFEQLKEDECDKRLEIEEYERIANCEIVVPYWLSSYCESKESYCQVGDDVFKQYDTKELADLHKKIKENRDVYQTYETKKPSPQKKKEYKYKFGKRHYVLLIIATIVLALSFVFMWAANKARTTALKQSELNNSIEAIFKEPGEELDDWRSLWTQPNMTWNDLEDGWKTVQSAWRARGLDISWQYIDNVKNKKISGTTIDFPVFFDALKYEVYEDYYKVGVSDESVVFYVLMSICFGATVFMVLPMFFILIPNINTYKENKKVTRYNEQELPIELAEFEKERERIFTERNIILQQIISILRELTEIIKPDAERKLSIAKKEHTAIKAQIKDKRFDDIRRLKYDLPTIATILESYRAETLKEAIAVYIADEREAADEAARREALSRQRQREYDEERGRRNTENDKRDVLSKAQSQDIGLQPPKMGVVAKQRRCLNCVHINSCLRARTTGQDFCASYLPKKR